MIRRLARLAVAAVTLASCTATTGAPAPPASEAPSPGITVFAAASLRAVLEQAKDAWEDEMPGVALTIAIDSSATLRTQIEQGAPADVFLSADTTNPQRLADAGLTDGDPVAFAANEIALIVPAGNPGAIASPADLGREGLTIVAAGEEVPITAYATEVVERLGVADAYKANIVSREDNVSAVVTKIELGEGDAALVYATDVRASEDVETVAIPDDANVTATYAGVVVRASREPAMARDFLAWLAEGDGQATLAGFGFLPPPTAAPAR